MSGSSSLLRLVSSNVGHHRRHHVSATSQRLLVSRRSTLTNVSAIATTSTFANDNNTQSGLNKLNALALAAAAAAATTTIGVFGNHEQKKKADCAAIAAVVGKEDFDAR